MPSETSAQMSLKDPDVALMLRVRDHADDAAFAELVDRHRQKLVGIMHHILGNLEEAEDVSQEVFIRIYRARSTYHPQAKFSTWLYTIAHNQALNALRSRARKPSVALNTNESGSMGHRPEEQILADSGPAPSGQMRQAELATIIRQALDTLNERQRMAVVLNKFNEMNYAEIATVMGLSTKAVKSLLSRARASLRDALQPYLEKDSTFLPYMNQANAEPEE